MQDTLLATDVAELLQIKTETKHLEYKQGLHWERCTKDDKVEIIKDILSMANIQDGGRIIIGVRNNDYEPIGITDEDFHSFDQTKVNDFLHKYTDPPFTCQVYKHILGGKNFVAIDVPEFPEIPIICKQDANSSKDNKSILRRGQLYSRTEKATSEALASAQEMRELLGRAMTKKGDELLGSIERLIRGRPRKGTEDAAEKYGAEIREADFFLEETIGEELKQFGAWSVIAYPTEYDPKRIPNQQTIKELINKSEVELRGWNVPHTDRENASNFQNGRESYAHGTRYTEGYQAYQSGLFVWKKTLWEDKEGHTAPDGRKVLSFISAIWTVTEILLFCKRYYETIAPDATLHLEIGLSQIKDRKLAAFKDVAHFSPSYIAKEQSIFIQEDIQVVDLRASYKEIANRIVKQIFTIFNWDDADPTMIDKWQTKLLERKY
jgi:schlafen family protein